MTPKRQFFLQLRKTYVWFTVWFVLLVLMLAFAEQLGMERRWIGYVFLAATILLYGTIGLLTRTGDPVEYYVAGRRVPAIFNGMAIAADWMSAASFISLAGALYLSGFNGLAFIMGWTGGFCLVALLIAPYLRKFGQYTIPDFLGARYGEEGQGRIASVIPRFVGIIIAILCSFTYLVAQIYGVGLITTRLIPGVAFEVGLFLGLGGILVCSVLGGMRAVTWTQVAQYIILILAYMVPVCWLAAKHAQVPIPQLVYGTVLKKLTVLEQKIAADPQEQAVRQLLGERAARAEARINALPGSLTTERIQLERRIAELLATNGSQYEINSAQRALAQFPKDAAAARELWGRERQLGDQARAPTPHAEPFPGATERERDIARRNFLTLMFCLMLGTAGLPHILTRFYTTPTVREARRSVMWSLVFIFALYFTAPALAVLVKYDIYTSLVGSSFNDLPRWVTAWRRVDASLISLIDINGDGIVQLAEIVLSPDLIVLATPEIAGLPYVISGLVAAGGLAAALSTADGLLLTISNALSHDLYHKIANPAAAPARRIMISKVLLLTVAVLAATVAAQKPAEIATLVSTAFSFAAGGFFPALVLGIFWKRANGWGASAGMLAGVGVTAYYVVTTQPWLRTMFGVIKPIEEALWWDIGPLSAGIFGAPVGLVVTVVVSLLTPAPQASTQAMVDGLRRP